MKIGILGPSGGEVGKLIESLEERRDKVRGQVRLYEGRLEGLPVVIGVSGVCKVNAAICAETLLLEGAECLLVCGVAGGIDPHLRIGDTVICREIAYHDVDISFLRDDPPYLDSPWFHADGKLVLAAEKALGSEQDGKRIYSGKCVTGEAFIADEGREEIVKRFDPLCTDMETAAAAHVAKAHGIPFLAFRSITDTAEKSGLENFHENYLTSSAMAQKAVTLFLREIAAE
ncbi:MAG: 5'-methylthioadenosine/S-adenosylhomocysteine nucleosidase [Clostridia bacterium]|nr:5'-methylthioadenosine/S-adenosylhomocysteine nucleosidase [Clostridia bacterium]